MKSVDNYWERYYKRNRILLVTMGLWPRIPKWARISIQFTWVMYMMSVMIPEYAVLVRASDNTDELIAIFIDQMTLALSFVVYYFFAKNSEWIRKIVNHMREDWRVLKHTAARDTIKRYAERGYTGTTWYLVVVGNGAIFFNLIPLKPVLLDIMIPLNASRSRSFVLTTDHSIYGIDVDKYYFAVMIHEAIASVVAMNFLVATNVFIVIIAEHCCGLFAAVGDILQQIGTYRSERQYLIVCLAVMIHHRAIKLAGSIEASCTMMYGYVLLITVILISTTGLQVITKLNEPAEVVRFSVICAGQMALLLFIAIPGQHLYDHSNRISEVVYNCNWWEISLDAKKLLSIMLVRSMKPIHLTAAGLYIQNMESFGKVLKTSFSVFTFLLSTR